MQKGFYFDQSRCIGCYTCVVACKDWHDVPAGPASWRFMRSIEKGKYPDLFVAYLSLSCCHCERPPCIDVCVAGAITKRSDDGIVVVDREVCLGRDDCGLCKEACPYDAPQFGEEKNATMQMCNFCVGRQSLNQPPVCVAACPMLAVDAGPLDELRAKYGTTKETTGFVHSEAARPAIIFKPKLPG